ncbi:pilus assembly FimT family protein [Fuerstiella marisgermanici]|uniref:Verru_Chthon cassette protein D n=1 Tax=Fuerstiella marisgermanici TaxID=1891926 RepID=A0A1P8WFK3_9PLAN|nr:prepilin-type N-terminal cleavage/methylation domain-containing protein [Fuerstiella marisgermanici]APZ92826.1 Verru_Chthon cassette protein D [Fuerstiella marisgermanici]
MHYRPFTKSAIETRRGFTLVELLVVIGILVLILSMTIYGVSYARDADRVSGAAGQIQSYLAGARDRAIYQKEPRGVRFFVDPVNTRAVTAMAYIKPGDKWPLSSAPGQVSLERLDLDGDNNPDSPNVTVVRGVGQGWWQLKRRGLIIDGSLIEIPAGSNSWYGVNTSLIDITVPPTPTEILLLQIPFSEPGDASSVIAREGETYRIQLPAQLLPREPSILPEGVVLDLDGSQIPIAWRPGVLDSEGQFSPYMDVFFSPRGNVIGAAAAAGLIHLYVCDDVDSQTLKDQWIASINPAADGNPSSPLDTFELQVRGASKFIPADEVSGPWLTGYTAAEPYLVKDRRLVTIFAQTGTVTVNEIDPTDIASGGNGFADNPYRFAEIGTGAK